MVETLRCELAMEAMLFFTRRAYLEPAKFEKSTVVVGTGDNMLNSSAHHAVITRTHVLQYNIYIIPDGMFDALSNHTDFIQMCDEVAHL